MHGSIVGRRRRRPDRRRAKHDGSSRQKRASARRSRMIASISCPDLPKRLPSSRMSLFAPPDFCRSARKLRYMRLTGGPRCQTGDHPRKSFAPPASRKFRIASRLARHFGVIRGAVCKMRCRRHATLSRVRASFGEARRTGYRRRPHCVQRNVFAYSRIEMFFPGTVSGASALNAS